MAAALIHKLTYLYNNEKKKHEFILFTLYNVLSRISVCMMTLVVVY